MLELLPLLDDVHALGVDEAVAVDPAQAHVRRSLHVGRLPGTKKSTFQELRI